MAHFAEIDENNIVTQVLVIDDEQEHRGQEFLANDLGLGGTWIQTSYNTYLGVHLNGRIPMRKNYAGIGYVYDSTRDAFYSPQPYPSWTLDESTCGWVPPVAMPPASETLYEWNEEAQAWVEVTV
jgi:hypothetical protein